LNDVAGTQALEQLCLDLGHEEEDVVIPKGDRSAGRGDFIEDFARETRILTARLALRDSVPGLRAHPLELQCEPGLLGELKEKLLGGTAIALSHRVPKIKLAVMVREALDECCRFQQRLRRRFSGAGPCSSLIGDPECHYGHQAAIG
jgi:hypothetical protein